MKTHSITGMPLLLCLVSACSSAPETGSADGASEAALWAGGCELPFRLQADPLAEQRARGRLAVISPDATLSWSAPRGTLALATNLDLSIAECEGNLGKAVLTLLESEPDLFQLDGSEWQAWPALSCAQPPLDQWISSARTQIAGRAMEKDVFAFRLTKQQGQLVLSAVSATYLPSFVPGLAERLDACPELSEKKASELAFAASMPYQTFDACSPTGDGSYTPQAGDTFELGKTFVAWNQGNQFQPVDIFLQSEGAFTVSPKHHTPELLQSNAHCPPTVGFRLGFEPTKPKLTEILPGIDCVVCLTTGSEHENN